MSQQGDANQDNASTDTSEQEAQGEMQNELAGLVREILHETDDRNFARFNQMLAQQSPNLMNAPKLCSRNFLDYLDFQKRMRAYLILTNSDGRRASVMILHGIEGDAFAALRENYNELSTLDVEELWSRLDLEFSAGEGAMESLPALISMAQRPNEKIDDYLIRYSRSFGALAPRPAPAHIATNMEDSLAQYEQLRHLYNSVVGGLEIGLFVRSIRPELKQAAAQANPFEMQSIARVLRRIESLSPNKQSNQGDRVQQPTEQRFMPFTPFQQTVPRRGNFGHRGGNRGAFRGGFRNAQWSPRPALPPPQFRSPRPLNQFETQGIQQPYAPQGHQAQNVRNEQNVGARSLRPRCQNCGGAAHPGRPCPHTYAAEVEIPWGAMFEETKQEQPTTTTHKESHICHAISKKVRSAPPCAVRANYAITPSKQVFTLVIGMLCLLAGTGATGPTPGVNNTPFSGLKVVKENFPLRVCSEDIHTTLFNLQPQCTPCAEPQWRTPDKYDSHHYYAIIRTERPVPIEETACWCRRKRTTCTFSEDFFTSKWRECADTELPVEVNECRIMCEGHVTQDGPLRPITKTHSSTQNTIVESFAWMQTTQKQVYNSECIRTKITARTTNHTISSGMVTRSCIYSKGVCETIPLGTLIWQPKTITEIGCVYRPIMETRCVSLMPTPNGKRTFHCAEQAMDFVLTKQHSDSLCPGVELFGTEQGVFLQLIQLAVLPNGKISFRFSHDNATVRRLREQNYKTLANIEPLHEAQLQWESNAMYKTERYFECRIQALQCNHQQQMARILQTLELLLPGAATIAFQKDNALILEGDLARGIKCLNVTEYEFLHIQECYRQPAVRYIHDGTEKLAFVGPGKTLMSAGTPCRHHRPQYLQFGTQIYEIRSRTVVTETVYPLFTSQAFRKADATIMRAHPNATGFDDYLTAMELIVEESVLSKPAQAAIPAQLRASSRSRVPGFLADLASELSLPFVALRRILYSLGAIIAIIITIVALWCCWPYIRRVRSCASAYKRGTKANQRVARAHDIELPPYEQEAMLPSAPPPRVPPPAQSAKPGLYPRLQQQLRKGR